MDRSFAGSSSIAGMTGTGSSGSATSSSAYAQLLETLGQQTEDLNAAVATCAVLKAENEALRKNYDSLREELMTLKGQYDEARRQAVTEAESRVATERRHEALVKQWQEQIAARERELDELQAQISPPRDLDQLRSQIASELEEAHLARLNAVEGELSQTRSAFMVLQREHEGLRVQFSATIEERAKDSDEAAEAQRTAVVDLQRTISRLQATVDDGTMEAERQVRMARGAQAEAVSRLRLLEAELEDCRAQRDELRVRVDENERRFTREAADLRAAVALAESQARGLERQLSSSESSFAQLSTAHAQLTSRAASQANDISRLQASLSTAERRNEEEMQGLMRRHAAVVAEMEQRLADAQGQIDRLSAESAVLSHARESFSAKITSLQTALHNCEGACSMWERRALQAEGQLEGGREALETLRRREFDATSGSMGASMGPGRSAAAGATVRGRQQFSSTLAAPLPSPSAAYAGNAGRRAMSAGPPPLAGTRQSQQQQQQQSSAMQSSGRYGNNYPSSYPSSFSRTAAGNARPFSAAGDLQPATAATANTTNGGDGSNANGKSLAGLALSRAIEAAVSVPAGTHSSSSYHGSTDSRGATAAAMTSSQDRHLQFQQFQHTGGSMGTMSSGERRLSGSAGPVNLGTFSTFPSSSGDNDGQGQGDTARQFAASPSPSSSPAPRSPTPSPPSPISGRHHHHNPHYDDQHQQNDQRQAQQRYVGGGDDDDSFIRNDDGAGPYMGNGNGGGNAGNGDSAGGVNLTGFSSQMGNEYPQPYPQPQRAVGSRPQYQPFSATHAMTVHPQHSNRRANSEARHYGSPLEEALSLASQAQGRADALQSALERCQQEVHDWRSKWERVTASVASSLEQQERLQRALADANSHVGALKLEIEHARRDYEESQRGLQRDVSAMQSALQQAEDALRQATAAFDKRIRAEREAAEKAVHVVAEKKEKYKLALLATRKKAQAYKDNLEALYSLYLRVKQAAIDNAKVQAIVASTRETEARVMMGGFGGTGLLPGFGGGGGAGARIARPPPVPAAVRGPAVGAANNAAVAAATDEYYGDDDDFGASDSEGTGPAAAVGNGARAR